MKQKTISFEDTTYENIKKSWLNYKKKEGIKIDFSAYLNKVVNEWLDK